MTVVLVHGNPETAAVWGPLVDALAEPAVVRLSPPGFGVPLPPGWDGSSGPEGYRAWLVGELEALAGPVHLVGHDWGGAHVVNVAMTRPDLLRSWCTDGIGLFDPDHTWHALARTWQTPGDGEEAMAALTAPTEERRAAYLTSIGVPAAIATFLAPGCADVSAAAVLDLYRAARPPVMAVLGRNLAAAARRPGLVLLRRRRARDRGDGPPVGRTGRRRDRGAARPGSLVDAGGPGPRRGRAAPVLGRGAVRPGLRQASTRPSSIRTVRSA